MGKSQQIPDRSFDDQFVNFMMHCLNFNDIISVGFGNLEPRTMIYAVQGVEFGKGYNGYTLKNYVLLRYDRNEQYIELEDSKGNYAGQFTIGENGSPIFNLDKLTGKQDPFEKTFIDYISAAKYMSHLKYIVDVSEERYLLAIFQRLKNYRGNYE
jgi:hypothetical protein